MAASRSRSLRTLLVLVTLCLASLFGRPSSPAAHGAAAPSQAAPSHIYLPALAHGWTWKTASLGDPYSPGLGNPGYDVLDYRLHLTFAQAPVVPATSFAATVELDLMVTAESGTELSFDLTSGNVTEVLVAELHSATEVPPESEAAPWYLGPGKLWVKAPRPLGELEGLRVTVRYEGSAPTVRVGESDGQAYLGPSDTSAWFPANYHPSDRARFEVAVTGPASYVAAASGRHVDTTDGADGQTSIFSTGSRILAPSEVVALVARFQVVERATPGGVAVRHYLLREPAAADAMLRAYENAVDGLSGIAGAYPFESFGVVETTRADIGVRPVSTLVLHGRTIPGQRQVTLERSIGNPVASQWFGGAIGVASHRDDWLNTGLAEYLNLLYAARDQGPELTQARLAAHEQGFAYRVGHDLALDDLPPNGSGALVQAYKAPWSFRSLHVALGDEAATAVLQDYFADRVAGPGTADLAGLQALAESAAGGPMGPLFDRLFRQAATPRINLAWLWSSGQVRLRVCQLTSQPVAFTLPLAIHGPPAGVMLQSVDVPARVESTFDLPVPDLAVAITPDPEQMLLDDTTVHPSPGAAPAPCAELPIPPFADSAPTTDADGRVAMDALTEMHHHERSNTWKPDSGLPEDRAGFDAPSFVPGEPSIGDDYFPYMGNTGYDVTHYDLKIRVDPDAQRVEADATLAISSTLDGLDRLSLDFLRVANNRGFEVREVTVDGAPATFERPADVDKLWVTLPAAVDAGGSLALRVRYDGTPPSGSGLRFVAGPMAFAVNEPNGTRGWIPANDHPRDKATFRFEVTAPKPYVGVANGVKVDQHETDTETTTVFEMRQPMASYLATIGVARYQVAEELGPNGLPLAHYFLNDPAVGMRVAGVTADTLDVFARRIAPYPFESYGHNAANGFGGAMENQSMTATGAGIFSTSTPRNSHGIIAHEAAHQWFGDAISPYTWADIWLNEGFATYLTEVWRYDDVGPELLGQRMESLRYSVLAGGRDAPVGRPIPNDFFGTNTYQKGAWVLHMLRAQVGDEAFWSGIRQYYADHTFGNVKSADLQAALEAASGQDLSTFFSQWVYRPGNPAVDVYWGQAGQTVTVRLCQVGIPFDLPLMLAAHGAGETVRASTRSRETETTVTLPAPFIVSGVTPDPDFVTLADFHVMRWPDGALPGCDVPAAAGP